MRSIALFAGLFLMVFSTIASAVWASPEVLTPDQLVVEAITCSGNESTNCELLKKELRLIPGEKLNEKEIENARIRLNLMGLFKEINITLKKGGTRGQVIVDIGVVEGAPYYSELTAGAIYDTYGSAKVFSGTIGNRNLFGNGKIFQGAWTARNDSTFGGLWAPLGILASEWGAFPTCPCDINASCIPNISILTEEILTIFLGKTEFH